MLNVIDLKDEIRIHTESEKLDKSERKTYKLGEREKCIENMNDYGHNNVRVEIENSTHRYTYWCLNHPLNTTLKKIM